MTGYPPVPGGSLVEGAQGAQSPALGAFDPAQLKASVDRVLSGIPAGRRGYVTGGVTTEGAIGMIGWRKGRVKAAGWAEKSWGAKGWKAGASATIEF